MANYFMLGGDGKEYGPIPADQLRQWATEGRANSQTQVRSADGGPWTSFSAVPELYESGFTASATHPALAQTVSQIGRSSASAGSEDTVKRLASVLASGSGWMKFLAVLMFIYGGFCILTITGIIFGWIPIWLGVVLWGAATRATQATYSGSESDLGIALDKVRFFFKLYGILFIVGFVFMLVMFVLFSAAIINGIQHTNFGGGGINLGH
jgi:hypothetical protein